MLMDNRSSPKGGKGGQGLTNKSVKNRTNTYQSQGEDYDFWSMPQNESNAKRELLMLTTFQE